MTTTLKDGSGRTVSLLLLVWAVAVLAAPAAAQPARKVPVVGMLLKATVADHVRIDTAFRRGLTDLGYVIGRNIRIRYAAAEGLQERLPALAAGLVRQKVDIIVTLAGAPLLAAMKASRTIPIVVGVAGDYVAAGYVKSVNRPGGNVTGMSTLAPDLMGKQLQILREIVPGLSKVAIMQVPGIAHATMIRQARVEAPRLGLGLVVVDVTGAADLPSAFRRMADAGVGAFIVLRSGFLVRLRRQIAARARAARLPSMFGHVHEVEAGGLIGYGADTVALWHEAARYVDKILKGADPAEMPIYQTRNFLLTVNLKTAKALGITIPRAILLRADKVVE